MIVRLPGPLDPHVHLRDLEWSHKATFASETAAAIAGGYTALIDMPNTPPATITPDALATKRARIDATAHCDWGLYFGASQDGNEAYYAQVADEVCGLKIYNNETTGTLLISEQAQRDRIYDAWPAHKPVAVHAEGQTVADILTLVRQYRKWTHFCHISTREEMDLLRAAKNEGLPISVGITPHHMWLTEDDLSTLGALGHMKPTLKTTSDRDSLWEGIADGIVDIVESDHAPHTLAEKQSGKPPYGVPGLETTIPLLFGAAKAGRLSIEQVVEFVAVAPRRIFGLPCGDDTYTLVDADAEYTIERQNLRGACGWSPFEGMQVAGRVLEVWIRGVKVFDGENVLSAPGFGQDLATEQLPVGI
jgi:carbamoyl-phosphate synthase/aspartate carbamoyltransferase/dihydroorotase